MKRRRSAVLALVIFAFLESAKSASAQPKLLGHLPARHAAFVRLLPGHEPGTQELLVSSFGIMGGDAISRVTFQGNSLDHVDQLRLQTVSNRVVWPNEVTPVPAEVFGKDFISVGTGFLVPGRSTGEVLIANIYSREQFSITTQKSGYFYHRVEWLDMNGDGRLDALTARAKKHLFGGGTGELVWLEQPEDDRRKPWVEHVIAKGPDVHFVVADLADDGEPEIIATEFFGQNLKLLWSESGQWKSKVIDKNLGSAFDVVFADVNLDGRKDIVVTNHEGGHNGAVYAYEIPEDFISQPWERHTLLDGIAVVSRSFNAAAPGAPVVWAPADGGKPRILIAGDGSCKLHMLVPTSNSRDDWTYRHEVLLETNSTIGRIWLGRLKSQGPQHLFVPSYDESKIYVFQMD